MLKAINEKIRQSGQVSLKLSGNSMYPTIKNGDEISVYAYDFDEIKKNDIIAFYFEQSTHYIIHRVVDIQNICGKRVLFTKGDNNNYIDSRVVKEENYVGIINVEEQCTSVFELAPNVFYYRNRNCVIKCDTPQENVPDDILPPIQYETNININRELTTELIILLSYKCNLKCIYCSNDAGGFHGTHQVTSLENIKKAIDFVVTNALLLRKISTKHFHKPARIIISGGGEPTVEWKRLQYIVETIYEIRKQYGNDIIELTILTNAQINNEQSDYLIRNFDNIAISCDGFSTQDKQRPRLNGESSKKYVERFLNKLNNHNKKVSIRMTVTGEALSNLQADVDYFFDKFGVVDNVIIEPYVQIGRGADADIKKLDYDDFAIEFDKIVRKNYEHIYNSASILEFCNSYPCQRLSGVSIVLSPYNVITCCDTVTPESKLWDNMLITTLNEEKVKIKNRYYHKTPHKCLSCIALDFCAGGCPMHQLDLDENEKNDYCKYRQNMTKMELLRRVDLSQKTQIKEYGGNIYHLYSLPRKKYETYI